MLCAQLPGSGTPFHYSSPRFRREALDDASKMVSTFQTATYALNLAKRKDAKEITENYQRQLNEARAREKEAEKEVDEGRQRERDLLAELEAQKAAVEAYRANWPQGSKLTLPLNPLVSSLS
jgi:chromosome segregation ATPase